MLAKTHRRFGLLGGIGAVAGFQALGVLDLADPADYESQIVAGMLLWTSWEFSLYPDFDMRGTTIARKYGPLGDHIATAVGDWAGAKFKATRTPADRNKRNPEHRTASHTLRFWCLPMTLGALVLAAFVSVALVLLWPGLGTLGDAAKWTGLFGFGVLLGNVMHLAGDAVTVSGVPVLAGIATIRGQYWYPIRLLPKAWCFQVGGEDDPEHEGEKKPFVAEKHLWAPILLLANIAGFALLFPTGIAVGVAGCLTLYFGYRFYRRLRFKARRAVRV